MVIYGLICFGHKDLYSCMLNLDIDDLNVYNMSSKSIRNVVLDLYIV